MSRSSNKASGFKLLQAHCPSATPCPHQILTCPTNFTSQYLQQFQWELWTLIAVQLPLQGPVFYALQAHAPSVFPCPHQMLTLSTHQLLAIHAHVEMCCPWRQRLKGSLTESGVGNVKSSSSNLWFFNHSFPQKVSLGWLWVQRLHSTQLLGSWTQYQCIRCRANSHHLSCCELWFRGKSLDGRLISSVRLFHLIMFFGWVCLQMNHSRQLGSWAPVPM